MINITNNYVRFKVEFIIKNIIFASELRIKLEGIVFLRNEDAKDLLGEFFLIITTDTKIVSPEA